MSASWNRLTTWLRLLDDLDNAYHARARAWMKA